MYRTTRGQTNPIEVLCAHRQIFVVPRWCERLAFQNSYVFVCECGCVERVGGHRLNALFCLAKVSVFMNLLKHFPKFAPNDNSLDITYAIVIVRALISYSFCFSIPLYLCCVPLTTHTNTHAIYLGYPQKIPPILCSFICKPFFDNYTFLFSYISGWPEHLLLRKLI